MKALLRKEWIVSKNLLIISFVLNFVVLFIVSENQLPIYLGLMLALFNVRNIDGLDDKTEYHQMIQSMPVSRLQVVAGKVLFHLIQVFSYLVLIVLLNALMPNFQNNDLSNLIFTAGFAIILVMGYQLIYVVFGPQIMNYVVIVLFLIFMLFGWMIAHSGPVQAILNFITTVNQLSLILGGTLILLALSFIMFFITAKIYERKDL